MSGGEKQRIQISRLFVKVIGINKNAPIALFDEPTSALDTNTEHQLMNTVKDWIHTGDKHKTAVFIAHRLSTIRDCDEIIVLAQGHVVQQGSHEDLIAAEGAYAKLILSEAAQE